MSKLPIRDKAVPCPKCRFSVRQLLLAILATSVLLALIVQLRHVGFATTCFLAGLGTGVWARNTRLILSSITALLVFVTTYLACWLQIGYVHRMGSPHRLYANFQVRQLRDALMKYSETNGQFPDSLGELENVQGFYLEFDQTSAAFLDGWKHPFRYMKTTRGFELVSLGRDGKAGGVGLDADVWVSEEVQTFHKVRLPLHQFVFETAGSRIVFWSACIASVIAGSIWFIPKPVPSASFIPLAMRLLVTTLSAVVVAAFLAAFHVAASQSGH